MRLSIAPLIVVCVFFPSFLLAQDAKIIAEGKKEGKVVIAAKAFLDYFYSDESLKVMAKFGEFVTRKGIHPPLPDVEEIQVVEMDEPDAITMAEKRKEYRRIFQ